MIFILEYLTLYFISFYIFNRELLSIKIITNAIRQMKTPYNRV